MRLDTYFGSGIWHYEMPSPSGKVKDTVDIGAHSSNYQEDETFARYVLQKKLGLARLPRGTRF